MARVRPPRASERIGWRPAKAASSAKVTASTGDCGAAIVAAGDLRDGSVAAPQVRQAAGQPPGLAGLVVAPLLAVAHRALLQGIAVDHADLDLAQHLAVAQPGHALLAVAGDLHLLVAREVEVGERVRRAHPRVDQVPGALAGAPAERRRTGVRGLS